MKDKDHHRGSNPFDELQLGMIRQFSLEYMHLVCSGVMKRLIMLWVSGPETVRIGPRVLERVSQNIKKCSFYQENLQESKKVLWNTEDGKQLNLDYFFYMLVPLF